MLRMQPLLVSALLTGLAYSSRVKVKPTVSQTSAQCPLQISGPVPAASGNLQNHFDMKREAKGILSDEISGNTCTKRDVCFLMKQLDMDFYQRATTGLLTDADFNEPPSLEWIDYKNCARTDRGKRFKPVHPETYTDTSGVDEPEDAKAVCSRMAADQRLTSPGIQDIADATLPAGCIIVEDRVANTKRLKMNDVKDSKANAGTFVFNSPGASVSHHERSTKVRQLCEHDRTLSHDSATYYSPYKLKANMQSRAQYSTSCSFGMMAYLSRLGETESTCGKILTFAAAGEVGSAQDALDLAAKLESSDPAKAENLRKYVGQIKQKYVLMDTIANRWCPQIWGSAMASNAVCTVPRHQSPVNTSSTTGSAAVHGSPRKVNIRFPAQKRTGGRAGRAGGLKPRANMATVRSVNSLAKEAAEAEDDLATHLRGQGDDEPEVAAGGSVIPASSLEKLALGPNFCKDFPEEDDQTLQSILDATDDVPPDFFRAAQLEEDREPGVLSLAAIKGGA